MLFKFFAKQLTAIPTIDFIRCLNYRGVMCSRVFQFASRRLARAYTKTVVTNFVSFSTRTFAIYLTNGFWFYTSVPVIRIRRTEFRLVFVVNNVVQKGYWNIYIYTHCCDGDAGDVHTALCLLSLFHLPTVPTVPSIAEHRNDNALEWSKRQTRIKKGY